MKGLKDWMSSVFSDLNEMKRLNKQESNKSYYTKIVPCKTALIQQLEKDLYRRIYKREICKDVLWRHEICMVFYASSDI